MKRRNLGPLEVPAIGLGCMVMPGFYFPGSEEQSIATLHRAAAIGMNFIDTADAYGNGRNEELVARAIKGRRGDYIIATKFGNVWAPDADYDVDGRPEYVAAACEASLRRLGIETIDLYYQHRVDKSVPIEQTAYYIESNQWVKAYNPTAVHCLTLSLLVLFIRTDDKEHALATNDLAIAADLFY